MPFWSSSRATAKLEEEENQPCQPLCVPAIKDPSCAGKKELLGVSVFHLETGLLETARAAGFSEESTIYELENLRGPPGLIRTKGQDTKCPIDGRLGAAYVHCLNHADHVGDATFMLSYTWGYTLGDIINALKGFCARHGYDPQRTYIWICFLCVNQHRVVEKRKQGLSVPTSVFLEEFQTRVLGIGRLLPLLTPWQQPTYLTRTWCIFEIFTAMERGVEIEILMPPNERTELSLALFDEGKGRGAFALYDALLRTKLENAKASEEQDRKTILELMENATGGIEQTNVRVNEYLRQWFRREIFHMVEEKERAVEKTSSRNKQTEHLAYANLCRAIGILFWRSSESDDALKMHSKALSSFEQVFGEGAQHHEIARIHSCIGSVHWKEKRHTEALNAYHKALSMYQLADGDNHNDYAVAHMNIGTVLNDKGDHNGALLHHQKALELFDESEYQNIATCHNNIGRVHLDKGDYDDALVSVEKTIAIRRTLLGQDNPDTARAFANLAVIHQLRGDPEAALIANEKALQVSRVVFGEKHRDTASLLDNRGIMLQSRGDFDASLEEHEKALAVFQEGDSKTDRIRLGTVFNNIGKALWRQGENNNRALEMLGLAQEMYMFAGLASDHPLMANTLNNVGLVMATRGDHSTALSVYRKALALREAKLGMNHPQTAETLVDMGRTIHAQGDYEEARTHFQRAMQIQKDTLGAGHKKTLETHSWIAKCGQSD